ncbi:hypothetical protein H5P28_12020 [Ruficoccus amylovorans]|uniref:Flagellar biosynthesis regulator FlaF n=2 Tax=Ruficoccus amylovorans TaxID=1804625 RepID=A0A842HHE2_9BACT|nr:flagellar biosynthesis regulator FlaF [Ruficoccus amylovorans]MBC2594984.1 hypothetical protein [Ruficoccus amylovorans]
MASAPSGRQVEVTVLRAASGKIRACLGTEGPVTWSQRLGEALRFNLKIWDVFIADWSAPECQLPLELRQNLLSLGAFIRAKSFGQMANPERATLETLLNINENLAAGVAQGPASTSSAPESVEAGQAV